MNYLSKFNIIEIAAFLILLLIVVTFILCNFSSAHYKTRITVDTFDLEIIPYQSTDTLDEEGIENATDMEENTINEDEEPKEEVKE